MDNKKPYDFFQNPEHFIRKYYIIPKKFIKNLCPFLKIQRDFYFFHTAEMQILSYKK